MAVVVCLIDMRKKRGHIQTGRPRGSNGSIQDGRKGTYRDSSGSERLAEQREG